MVLNVIKRGDIKYLYIVKKVRVNGKPTSKTILNCGKLSDLEKEYDDPIAFFTNKAKEMTQKEKEEETVPFMAALKRTKIGDDKEILLNGGYLFLRKIYVALHLDRLTKQIKEQYKLKYDLDKILQDLIYSRIIFPGSKLSSFEDSKCFIEKGDYELHDVYRSLSVLNEWFDKIQSYVYKTSTNIVKRNKSVLYFDCTNFFFETEKDDSLRRHGVSKEHRPNPLVQLGLFMDGNGLPLAIDINPGNTNEQITLRPFETKVLKDFKLSKVIVCTDAGLASYSNREFNDIHDRAFIVTQPIKKLRGHLKSWCLSKDNFRYSVGSDENKIYYKTTSMIEKVLIETDTPLGKVKMDKDWNLIVTYSKKYAAYQKSIRDNQIKRAKDLINNPSRFNKVNAQDCKRFIKSVVFDKDGEIISTKSKLEFDPHIVEEEELYDGFYCVCTNLNGNIKKIIEISKRRWEIEESFRIMKTNLKSRPVYVSLEEHINAHFLTCFLALLFVRIVDTKLNNAFTVNEIISSLRKINYTDVGLGYFTSFKMTPCIKALMDEFQIECDYNSYTPAQMRKVINFSKKESFATTI